MGKRAGRGNVAELLDDKTYVSARLDEYLESQYVAHVSNANLATILKIHPFPPTHLHPTSLVASGL